MSALIECEDIVPASGQGRQDGGDACPEGGIGEEGIAEDHPGRGRGGDVGEGMEALMRRAGKVDDVLCESNTQQRNRS